MPSVRKLVDIRPHERALVLLAVAYMATVVASFLLAKPIRNALFLKQYGAYKLVYVYAGVPLALSLVVPLYARLSARIGDRRLIVASLLASAASVVAFWAFFRFLPFPGLPGVFYIWVNCYGIIAPVQAWSLIGGLFDTRQAKRLYGLVGSGASLGAIGGGVIASTLVRPVGGAENLLLVLAALIGGAAALVTVIRRTTAEPEAAARAPTRWPFVDTLGLVWRDGYLRQITALVFLVAIVTQWSGFQFSVVAEQRFAGDADHLTAFFGRFNVAFGLVALATQLILTGTLLRRVGIVATILLLPMALGAGSLLIVLLPGFWTVVATNAGDQTVRFSVDKASYELLYLPLPPAVRARVRGAIDVFVNRLADAVGAVLLGLATQGFVGVGGLGFGLRGTAAINLVFIAAWMGVARRLRTGYVDAIRASVRTHALATAGALGAPVLERAAAAIVTEGLEAREPRDILYALDLMSTDRAPAAHPALFALLTHPAVEVRRKALALLSAAGDAKAAPHVEPLLQDEDLEIRTDALLFLVRHLDIDPLARVQALGDVAGFSIRAGMAAFLAHPGSRQNLDAARAILAAMAREPDGGDGARTRLEAVRVIDRLPPVFDEELAALIGDRDETVAREAIGVAGRRARVGVAGAVAARAADAPLQADVAAALAAMGDAAVAVLRERLLDPATPMAVRREIPEVLARIATPDAERMLLESLLQPDTSMRHGVIAALNTMRAAKPEIGLDPEALDVLLVAEITGHYRSYQVLGALGALPPDDQVVAALRQSMEQEIERVFRLLGLLCPGQDIHAAYLGLRAADGRISANALELLDQVLQPPLRGLVVPLIDPHVTLAERVALANRLVGVPVSSLPEALATLLHSEDSWLKSCAAYAVGAMRIDELKADLDRWAEHPDPLVRETVRAARRKLEPEAPRGDEEAPAAPWDSTGAMGVG